MSLRQGTEPAAPWSDDTYVMRPTSNALVIGALAALAACAPVRHDAPRAAPDDGVDPDGGGVVVDDPRVQKIVDAYTTSMSTCPEKIWPGHDWNDNRVVLLSKSKATAWVWSGASLTSSHEVEVDEVAPASLPVELSDFEFYSVGVLDGAVSLGIDLDLTEGGEPGDYDDLAILLAFHEGFHNLGGQDDFVVVDTGGRDPVLPLDWQPRFIRDEQIKALRAALAADGGARDAALGVARHWQDRYQNDAAADRASLAGLDVIEGTAQYVESVAVIVAHLGCDASDGAIEAEAQAHADNFVVDAGLDSGGESYALGPAAGLLLRGAGQGFEDAAKSTPLAELLLAGVVAADVDEQALASDSQNAESTVGALNDDVAQRAAPLLSQWDDAGTVRVALPYGAMNGSFAYESGFIFGDRADDAHVLLSLSADFIPSTGSASIGGVNVVEDDVACDDDTFALPVDPAAITREGDVITVHSAGLDVDGVTIREAVVDGRTWLCAR